MVFAHCCTGTSPPRDLGPTGRPPPTGATPVVTSPTGNVIPVSPRHRRVPSVSYTTTVPASCRGTRARAVRCVTNRASTF